MAVAVAVAVGVSGGGALAQPVAVAVAGLTKRFFNHIQKDFLINVWGFKAGVKARIQGTGQGAGSRRRGGLYDPRAGQNRIGGTPPCKTNA